MHSKGLFPEVWKVLQEYFDQEHAEEVPQEDWAELQDQVFYLLLLIVCKESSILATAKSVQCLMLQ